MSNVGLNAHGRVDWTARARRDDAAPGAAKHGPKLAMAEQTIPVTPQLTRGQRVYELAQGQQCAFVQQTEQQF